MPDARTIKERYAAGEPVPVQELLDSINADCPKSAVFERWHQERDLPPVVMDRVTILLRALERHNPEFLDHLILGLECNQPGISGGMATYTGD